MFLMPGIRLMAKLTPASSIPTWPGWTSRVWSGVRVYWTSSPSSSTHAMPDPPTRCRMNPSPPKSPAPSDCWKAIDSSIWDVPQR